MKCVFMVTDGGDDFWYVSESADKAKQLHITTQYESAEIQLDDEDKAQMKVTQLKPYHYLTIEDKSRTVSEWARDNNGFIGTTAT